VDPLLLEFEQQEVSYELATPADIAAGNSRARAAAAVQKAIAEARVNCAKFIEFAIPHEKTGKPVRNQPFHEEWHRHLDSHDYAVLVAPVEHAKALPVDTPIPTPSGFVEIVDLRVGDRVFGSDGVPCKVTGAYAPWLNRELFRLVFDDGTSIEADADHQWTAWTQDDLDENRSPRVVSTEDIVRKGVRRGRDFFWKMPLPGPVQYPQRSFVVHPYVLGAWLGDGHSASARITCHEEDYGIVRRCIALDNGVAGEPKRDRRRPSVLTTTVGGDVNTVRGDSTLRSRLRQIGVLGNKHIPGKYLEASEEQRRHLLAGLLDTDGTCDDRGRVSFASSSRDLAVSVLRLVRSLGYKPTLVGPNRALRVCFSPHDPVFALPRKGARQCYDRPNLRHRTLRSVERVETKPVRCISVDSSDPWLVLIIWLLTIRLMSA